MHCLDHTPIQVKLEPCLETTNELSDDHLPLPSTLKFSLLPTSALKTQSSAGSSPSISRLSLLSNATISSVFVCLKKLASTKGSRNVFKLIDYNAKAVTRVQYLPPQYTGDVIFQFPPLGTTSMHSKAKQLCGMDK